MLDDRFNPAPDQVIHPTAFANLSVLPASSGLTDVNHARPQCLCLKLCHVAAQTAVHKANARALKAGASGDDVRQLTAALRAYQVGPARAVTSTTMP